jgi:hypothetical protein
MNPPADLMQLFRRSLTNWLPYLKKRLNADDIRIDARPNDFDVVMVRAGATKIVTFDKVKVFGENARMPLREQRMVQPVCRFVDDIVMELT